MTTNMDIKDQPPVRECTQAVPAQDDWLTGEPRIRDMLSDPIVHLVMRRDNLGPTDVWTAIDRARAALNGAEDHSRDVA